MSDPFSVNINGENVLRPGVYTTSNDRAMTPPRGGVTRRMAVIAEGRGGVVGGLTPITDERGVLQELVGGQGAQLAMTAVKRGAQLDFIRVNKATPASASLGDLLLTAVAAGLQGRALQVERFVNAARADAYDLILKDSRTGRSETYSRLGPAFDVTYVGTGTAPQVAVTSASGLTTVTLSATGAVGDTLTLTSDVFSSVQGVLDAINNSGAWTARASGDAGGNAAPLADLKTGATVLAGGKIPVAFGVSATIRALSDSKLARASVPENPAAAAVTSSPLYFTGGGEGPATVLQDWVDALAVAEKSGAYGIVIGSGDPAVLAVAVSHARRMSSTKNRRERVIYAGPALQSTKTALTNAAVTLADTLGNERLVLLADQGRDYDVVTGKLVRVSAASFAADACAVYIAGTPEQGITKARCGIPEREYEWGEEEIENFILNGVICVDVDPDDGILKYEQGLTSYTTDANVMRRKIAGMGIKDYLAQRIRQRLKRFIGNVGDETTISEIVVEVAAVLNEESRSQAKPRGVLTAGENPLTGLREPAWKNIVAVMDGFDLVGVEYECHPVGEVAYIKAEATFTPVKIRATA